MTMLRLTRKAETDLDDNFDYIADDNPEAAEHLIYRITDLFESLVAYPEMGRTFDELIPGIRCVPVGNYVIFYRFLQNDVVILRVIHAARDITSDLFAT